MITDHRTRRTAKKLGHSLDGLSRWQNHIIHAYAVTLPYPSPIEPYRVELFAAGGGGRSLFF